MSLKNFYKIQKQIIDRSWRHPPKPPVLPCLGDEFTTICGTIERIDIEQQQQAFEVESYENMKEIMERTERAAKIGAIIGALRGQVGLTGMADNQPILRDANFVNVQIENKIYCGWLGDCPFREGDNVEVVVEWQNDHYELYAIAKPDERIISVCPNCFRGRWAYFFYVLSRIIIMWLLSLLVMTGLHVYYYSLDKVLSLSKDYIDNISMSAFTFGLFALAGLIIAIKDSFKTKVKIAEQIFNALNLPKISRIDLRKYTNRKCWKLKFQGKYTANINKPKINYRIKICDNNLFYY
ncbi:hypothetical protein J3U08_11410 [Gilliamella sp. B2894]|uniref:putative type VI secretion system effector n=1 Tax=Gilliamella sp. B2894 TaxID=2817978 RepID=UPI002269BEEF|nr:putative type VI secretion system effector [Gilliamella sp. B2894]MCX8657396.1 hypothetical protein [Gilliamella sp. B2894]